MFTLMYAIWSRVLFPKFPKYKFSMFQNSKVPEFQHFDVCIPTSPHRHFNRKASWWFAPQWWAWPARSSFGGPIHRCATPSKMCFSIIVVKFIWCSWRSRTPTAVKTAFHPESLQYSGDEFVLHRVSQQGMVNAAPSLRVLNIDLGRDQAKHRAKSHADSDHLHTKPSRRVALHTACGGVGVCGSVGSGGMGADGGDMDDADSLAESLYHGGWQYGYQPHWQHNNWQPHWQHDGWQQHNNWQPHWQHYDPRWQRMGNRSGNRIGNRIGMMVMVMEDGISLVTGMMVMVMMMVMAIMEDGITGSQNDNWHGHRDRVWRITLLYQMGPRMVNRWL